MRKIKTTVATWAALGVLAALMFTGCATSLHPFFDEQNVIFDHALLGEWVNDSGDKCAFTNVGEKQYELLYTDETSARFETRLIELGGRTYLDLYPKTQENDNGFLTTYFVPTHTLVRVTIGGDSISIAPMNRDRLIELSESNQLNLAHERLANGTIMLIAPSKEMQAFVINNAADEDLFSNAEVFRHIQPE